MDKETNETDVPFSRNIERGVREMTVIRYEICKRMAADYNIPI